MNFLFGFLLGVLGLFGYMIWRMMRSDGWDKSNVTNAIRLIIHVVMHPEDFGKMYYLTNKQLTLLLESGTIYDNPPVRPFWYIDKDELSEVVQTRPEDDEDEKEDRLH